jgi:hypothetical protein
MARGGLKKSYDRQKKSRLSDPELVRSGVNLKDSSLLDSIKGGILDVETAQLNTLVDISGSIPTKRNGYGDVVAKYDIDTITSAIDASLTQTRYENETFEKVLDTSISELLPTGGGLSLKEFFANYEQLKDEFPAYADASSHEYLYSSSLSYLADEVEAAGVGEFAELDAPEITVQPIGPRVVSDEVEIEIGPVGAIGLDLKYQWRKDGTEIPNETSDSLIISSTSEDDNGIYTCQITNDAGAILSSDVKVTIVPLYASGFVESKIIKNGGGENGLNDWIIAIGDLGVRSYAQDPRGLYPEMEVWDTIVAEEHPYLQVVNKGEIFFFGGSEKISIVYQEEDLLEIDKAIKGKVEGIGGLRYQFYGWLGGMQSQADYTRAKVEWIDAGNTVLDYNEIVMPISIFKSIMPGGSGHGMALTGIGDAKGLSDSSYDVNTVLNAVDSSWKTMPAKATKARVTIVMDRMEGTEANAYVDNLSIVALPVSSEEISAADAAAEAAAEAAYDTYIQTTFDWQDPTTYAQAPAPTYNGTYDGEFSNEHEATHPSAPGEWRWNGDNGSWVPAYTWTGSSTSSGTYTNLCFTETALVFMADGKYKRISKIKEGDKILTFDESTKEYSQGTVTDFLTHEVNNLIPAAKLINKEFDIDPLIGAIDHPIYYNGRWNEIQESKVEFEMITTFIDNYYNLEVDGHDVMSGNHNYIVNGYIVSGLGDNPILNRFYQRQNIFRDLEKKRASII